MVAIALLSTVTWVMLAGADAGEGGRVLYDEAADLARVMEKTGLLNNLTALDDVDANASVYSFLSDATAINHGSQATVSWYRRVSGGICPLGCGPTQVGTFCLCRQVYTETNSSFDAVYLGSSKRVFYTKFNGTYYFGIAEVWAWAQ
ncbi:TPA: hypothetical protein HA318_00575 [Candidatus Micrarchaeota archaeon]|nr:hypothetical protein [Candidatus Micrarchaeota archaeon]